jgi:hypothetical protein
LLLRTIKDGGEFVKGFSAAGGIKKDPGAPGGMRGDWADGPRRILMRILHLGRLLTGRLPTFIATIATIGVGGGFDRRGRWV